MKEVTVRITGEAGQGMQTVGIALARICKRNGFHVFAHQDYMSRIRGGNNYFQLRIAEQPVFTPREKCDVIVTLDKDSVARHRDALAPGGIVVLDRKQFGSGETGASFFDVPLFETARAIGDSELFVNSVAGGLAAGMLGVPLPVVEEVLQVVFKGKGEETAGKNRQAARAGYAMGTAGFRKDVFSLKPAVAGKRLLVNGSETIALGAVRAGCRFFSAYPMSPSTGIMTALARYARDFNLVVEQAEDEIAAVNMAVGASFAGVRSLTATSGGGFALMVEGLSLAAMTETPLVIVDAQRPAPATGFPTRTEQADLEFLLHAGHGEFARAIYSPGTIEQAFYLTVKAFNLAEKYQVPVLILSDQHLADSYQDVEMPDPDRVRVERHVISRKDSEAVTGYKRYRFTETGISPRAVPSWISGVVYADSDEHTEEGHITESAEIRVQMVEKRLRKKMAGLRQETEPPEAVGVKGADVVLLGFGSTCGAIREAVAAISSKKIGFVHLSQVWPFPAEELRGLLEEAKKVFTVENNAGAQLARLLRRETGIEVYGSILKYDGRPFSLDELKARVEEMV